jgi:hypothetical protein
MAATMTATTAKEALRETGLSTTLLNISDGSHGSADPAPV